MRLARNNVLVSEWQLRQRAIDVMTQTVFSFNELHLAHENFELAKRSRVERVEPLRPLNREDRDARFTFDE